MACERCRELERFKPTAEAINALPRGVRRFVYDLETRADPAGDTRARVLAEDTVRSLLRLLAELDPECLSDDYLREVGVQRKLASNDILRRAAGGD